MAAPNETTVSQLRRLIATPDAPAIVDISIDADFNLGRLSTVVRASDTNTHDLAPQAADLLAISVGLSRLHRDDQAQLKAGLALYDALYRWARDGMDEPHDWPAGQKP